MPDIYDVIEAFVDDELVDPAALEQALADPAGRAHLVDTIALRGVMRRASAMPLPVTHPARRRPRPLLFVCAAAGLTLVASIGGYVAGTRAADARALETAAAAPAPAPTQVIRFTPGFDWTERAGGN